MLESRRKKSHKGDGKMDVIELRRDLHRHPEVGFTEFRTASKVVETLTSLGYNVVYGDDAIDESSRLGVPDKDELDKAYERAIRDGANPDILKRMRGGLTGVVGMLKGKKPGPTIAFRFDMDALPIQESSDDDHFPHSQGFRSLYDRHMHACAHDGHTAIGLSLAEKMAHRNFAGTLKLIFQPAEEGVRGAYAMVQKGMVDDVDELYGMHLGIDKPSFEVYGGSTGWLATTKLLIHFHGVPANSGGAPEKGRHAILGAATAALNIHAITRFGTGITRVNVGVLEGGTAPNIVPYFAKMVVETRSDIDAVNQELVNRVRIIVKNSAEMYGLEYDINVIGQATTLTCDEELVDVVLDAAKGIEPFHTFERIGIGNGSEDASFLMKRVQERGGKATYMIIGSTLAAPHHHQKFDIDEQTLPASVQLLENIANRRLS